jgi:hypothetical protein
LQTTNDQQQTNPNFLCSYKHVMALVTVSVNAEMKKESFEYVICPGRNQTAGYPHYTTTTVNDSAEVGPVWMNPFSVQYTEGSSYQETYAINNGQILYPSFITAETGTVNTIASEEYCSGDTTATTCTYTELNNISAQGVIEDQLFAQESNAPIPQQDAHSIIAEQSNSLRAVTADDGGVFAGYTSPVPSPLCSVGRNNSSHTVRTMKATDEWLKRNYEVAKGETLLHSTLQSHYHRHCKENKLHPVSIPTLGRRVRKVFPAVEKRRLGKRGDSKYHYCGIRVIPESAIYQLTAVCSRPSSQLIHKLPQCSGGRRRAIQKTENQYEQNMNHSQSFNDLNSSSQHHYHHQESQNDDQVTLKKRTEGRASFRRYRKCQFQFSYPE